MSLYDIDWKTIPAPKDDGAADHLTGMALPPLTLIATDGAVVDLSALPGRTVVFAFPKTGQPGTEMPDGWDMIPGARGCTPQSCAFRDLYTDLLELGVAAVFGLSVQDTDYQREAATRLHLPFSLLSDAGLALTKALKLPTLDVDGATLQKRMAMVIDNGQITKVFYPVFPPDQNAADVINWLKANA